ncbi:ankyrin repeat domain-containing protein [Olivibacter sitiensis]|uniref:ankyrin repeat domain-containing protein n=1 Tax=Olivibacter sitiensis TaxID=376470 RepID=UPI00040FC9F0|nr:ankyrin repeat domain-containing protein [Olivibacter sitiensis]
MSLSLLEEYIESGNNVAIDKLLASDPSLCLEKTSHDISPLLLACYYNKPQTVKVILKHAREITLFEAAAAGLADLVSDYIEEDPSLVHEHSEHGFSALGLAVHFGNADVVRYLILKGANVNDPSSNGYNVFPLHTAVSSNFDTIAKMLVEAGAVVNVRQAANNTPLHAAAQNGNIELLILLLENGAEVDAKNDFGKTPADLALEKGYEEIGKILS